MRQHLTSIVAIDRNGAIGCKNELPWTIKSDMAFFRKTTMGNVVIMGRKTYQSIGSPLKGRLNLVLSHNAVLFPSTEQCRLVNSVGEALADAFVAKNDETFVIGGAATYIEFAPIVDRYLVTFVDHVAPDGDAFLAQSIRDMFPEWNAREIANLPAVPGQDEFAFRIVEFSAPDEAERREQRNEMVDAILDKRPTAKSRRAASRNGQAGAAQEAFFF
ncbi:MAG: dihydrofolate reductase [Novosphingobium sp.]